jgi:hypothetical protein
MQKVVGTECKTRSTDDLFSAHLPRHVFRHTQQAVGECVFIVVPDGDHESTRPYLLDELHVDNGDMRVPDDVRTHNRVVHAGQDFLHASHGSFAKHIGDIFDGHRLLQRHRQFDETPCQNWHTNTSTNQSTSQLRDHQTDGPCSPRTGRDDVPHRRAPTTRVLPMPAVVQLLVLGHRMHGHKGPLLNTEGLVQNKHWRREAIRRTRRWAHEPHARRQELVVHIPDETSIRRPRCRSRNEHAASTTVQEDLCLLLALERPRAVDDDIYGSMLFPRYPCGVAHKVRRDLLAPDDHTCRLVLSRRKHRTVPTMVSIVRQCIAEILTVARSNEPARMQPSQPRIIKEPSRDQLPDSA